MDILLINNNPVVERLFSICIENIPSRLDKKKFLTNKDLANYDIVFIDDTSYSNSIEEILKSTHIGTRILLASKKFQLDNPALFDEIIYKPFLPTKISEIILLMSVGESMSEFPKCLSVLLFLSAKFSIFFLNFWVSKLTDFSK